MPFVCDGEYGKMARSGQALLGRECEFVVRFAECDDRVGHGVEFGHATSVAADEPCSPPIAIARMRTSRPRSVITCSTNPLRESELDKLALEQSLFVLRVRLHVRRRHESRRRIERRSCNRHRSTPDRNVIDDTCPSPVARRLKNESLRTGRHARLIGVPNHRRIEQCRRFERVLLREISADQQLADSR